MSFDFLFSLSKTELFTLLIVIFTALTFVYQRKVLKVQKPLISKIQYMYKDDIHLFLTIVNAASHLIAIKNIYLLRLFIFIPITIQKVKYEDPSDKEQDPIVKNIFYDRYRSFIEKEDTIHSFLEHPLKLKSLHLLLIATTNGFCIKFFRPCNYLINISE